VQVTIDPNAGFCFGVGQAIREAEHALDSGEKIYCLGDIVHNAVELDRLKAKGLEVIDHSRLRELQHASVLIRAHGEPPSTYEIAENNHLVIIDATCPIVQKLQQRIHKHYQAGIESQTQVVIFGKVGHAEVSGLSGQTDDNAIVVNSEADLQKIDFSKPVKLFAQTTMDKEAFNNISIEIEQRMKLAQPGREPNFEVFDTICRQVSGRAPSLKEFAAGLDVLIFVSGSKSSNGAYLFEICRTANPNSYRVSDAGEMRPEWFEAASHVGVTGATSTPLIQLQDVARRIEEIAAGKQV
jgi:(E)-4-hydroxy-3-methyl-but-2-enyl pyrophosphate reductase (IPP and DMAPP forming)